MPIGSTYPSIVGPLDGSEVVGLFQGGRFRDAQSSDLATLAASHIGSAPVGSGQMYSDRGALTGRFADRLLVGAATDNMAASARDLTPRDWLSDIMGQTSVGAWQLWGAQGASLARFGSIGWLGASRTSDAKASTVALGYTPSSIGICAFAVADDTSNPTNTNAYAIYSHAVRMPGVSYQPTFSAEFEIENRGALPIGSTNPYHINLGGGTHLLQLGSGGGQSSGTNDASSVITVVSNPSSFLKGIVFQSNAISGTDGSASDGGFGAAMVMGRMQGLEWYAPDGNSACILRSTVTVGNLGTRIEFQDSGLIFVNQHGQGLLSISNNGGNQATNTMNFIAGSNPSDAARITIQSPPGGNPNFAISLANNGKVELDNVPVIQQTAATPATASFGFLEVLVNGTDCRIPLYLPGQIGG